MSNPDNPQNQDSAGEAKQGQWVWQFSAPPPPPPFSAVFFSGRALGELYRFFACALLVAIGTLLPWSAAEPGELVTGVTLPVGALCLAIALWLMSTSAYAIYTSRQKILPVFLMIIPAAFTWKRTMAAWGTLGDEGFVSSLGKLFELAGSGVMLALIGSTIVTAQLVFVSAKVWKKTPAEKAAAAEKDARRKARTGKDKDKEKGKSKDKAKVKDKAKDAKAKASLAGGPATDAS